MPEKPTTRQAGFLEDRHIAVPPSKKVASRLIGFIKDNNGMGPATASERIALVISAQKKWNGKRIDYIAGGPGIVKYITAPTKQEVETMLFVEGINRVPALQACIKLDTGKTITSCSLSCLKLLEPENT